jgi:GNAT superfamily N-acetyltransferase
MGGWSGRPSCTSSPVAHERGPWCRITALVVHDGYRGRGVGTALAAAAEDAARAAGCARVEATSAIDRHDAHAFYERRGYRREAAHFLKRLREPAR